MSNFYEEVIEPARHLEEALGLPSGFLEQLQEADDWSFVVKTHALIEAAVAHALVARTGLNSASNFFSRLELSNSKTGKLALIEALDLLSSEERRFIRALSELRNFFVHDVKNVAVSLPTYLASLSKDKRKVVAMSFCSVDFNKTAVAVSEREAMQRLEREPKRAIWETAMFVVALLQLQVDTDLAKRLVVESRLEFAALKKKLQQ